MAVPTSTPIPPPDPSTLLTPLLPALTAAAASKEPAVGVLPLLTPILRQRVQFLSATSSDPWLRLLCYDHTKARQLSEIVATPGPALEPHPVSGEVEVDWDYDAQRRFRRIDSETLQALYVMGDLGLAFLLVYCVGDPDGGDGWRVGEVTVAEKPEPFVKFGGAATQAEAEKLFAEGKTPSKTNASQQGGDMKKQDVAEAAQEEEEEDDDDYWAQYDATPGAGRSPAPGTGSMGERRNVSANDDENENDYYAQYDSVQPAMDNHDPDEEMAAAGEPQRQQLEVQPHAAPPLGLNGGSSPPTDFAVQKEKNGGGLGVAESLLHPRPESSASSNGSSQLVARLEEEAGRQGQNEFGVKQHISRSVRSLFMLSRASGIDREEFERLVKTELDVLGMMDEES